MSYFFRVESLIQDVNHYFNNENNLKTYKSIDVEYFKKNIFCARYHLDNIWYRAKVLRECGADKVSLFFAQMFNFQAITFNST